MKSTIFFPLMSLGIFLGAATFFSCSRGIGSRSSPVEIGKFETLRICTENLNRFGETPSSNTAFATSSKKRKRRETEDEQLFSLVKRMSDARCDLVAVQEVLGKTKHQAQLTLEKVASALEQQTQRSYLSYVGASEDPWIRNGFLVAKDLSAEVRFQSYDDVPLARLVAYGPVGNFQRPPISVRLLVNTPKNQSPVPVFVFNIHFKSRSFGFKDVLHTDYEALRMEMAETSRRLFLAEMRSIGGQGLGVLLGDRNSESESASALILSGTRILDDFQRGGACTLERKGRVDCGERERRAPQLIPLLEEENRLNGESYVTYRYRGRTEILDEILVPESTLPRISGGGGRLQVGVQGSFQKGSDHLLSWVQLELIND